MAKIEITNSIRRLRFEHGEMTQQELADRVGVTRQTVNAIELGKYSPSLEVAFLVARTFGVGVEEVFELVGGTDESTQRNQGRRGSGNRR
jgi:putative transcriptional regulator